jgi:hypothetical protein
MKYLKEYNQFIKDKEESVNEELFGLGKLFKGLKNKLSLGFSKMFGSAADVTKLMDAYKKEIILAGAKKKAALSAYATYIASVKNGGDKNDAEAKKMEANIKTATANYDKQLELIKQKFDIKFGEIVKEEENEKIKNYITLKKIEMQQELLEQENKVLLTDAGLTEEDVKGNPVFMAMLKNINDKAVGAQKMADDQKKALESKDIADAGFDFEKAKADKNYLFADSEFAKGGYKFATDEQITFWSNTDFEKDKANYKGSEAFIGKDNGLKTPQGVAVEAGNIYVTKEIGKPVFAIKKGKVIDTKKNAEEAAKKEAEEKPKEEAKPAV